ncbi:MAG: 2-C-methyl-D-erythritol 4-phosphate cytidylyltransferase [Victivallaceae bacterium]|nr:IspD/TarI family cytidylyltransferase [Victivallaceae bacterium]
MTTALILAGGGSSSRFGGGNKLLAVFDGLPVFLHSAKCFAPLCAEMVMTVPSCLAADFEAARAEFAPEIAIEMVPGGVSRSGSVRNALNALRRGCDLVAVHDAARPWADAVLFEKLVLAAAEHGGAIPGTRMTDTVKQVLPDGRIERTLNRNALITVQTPQIFRLDLLVEAYRRAGEREFTDDAAVMEAAGFPVVWIEGPADNRKITFKNDLPGLGN